jgi:hypothetical protein
LTKDAPLGRAIQRHGAVGALVEAVRVISGMQWVGGWATKIEQIEPRSDLPFMWEIVDSCVMRRRHPLA